MFPIALASKLKMTAADWMEPENRKAQGQRFVSTLVIHDEQKITFSIKVTQ